MAFVLDLPHQNKGHSDVDTAALVQRVADRVEAEHLLKFTKHRQMNATAKAIPDLMEVGTQKILSSTLPTFNKKFKSFVSGHATSFDEEGGPLEQCAEERDDDGDADTSETNV